MGKPAWAKRAPSIEPPAGGPLRSLSQSHESGRNNSSDQSAYDRTQSIAPS
jgi:hypothetical protein